MKGHFPAMNVTQSEPDRQSEYLIQHLSRLFIQR